MKSTIRAFLLAACLTACGGAAVDLPTGTAGSTTGDPIVQGSTSSASTSASSTSAGSSASTSSSTSAGSSSSSTGGLDPTTSSSSSSTGGGTTSGTTGSTWNTSSGSSTGTSTGGSTTGGDGTTPYSVAQGGTCQHSVDCSTCICDTGVCVLNGGSLGCEEHPNGDYCIPVDSFYDGTVPCCDLGDPNHCTQGNGDPKTCTRIADGRPYCN